MSETKLKDTSKLDSWVVQTLSTKPPSKIPEGSLLERYHPSDPYDRYKVKTLKGRDEMGEYIKIEPRAHELGWPPSSHIFFANIKLRLVENAGENGVEIADIGKDVVETGSHYLKSVAEYPFNNPTTTIQGHGFVSMRSFACIINDGSEAVRGLVEWVDLSQKLDPDNLNIIQTAWSWEWRNHAVS